MENWKNRLHEVSMRRCARLTRSVRWVENELREIPTFEGLTDLVTFLNEFEEPFIELQRLSALDHSLKVTPARWWVAHKNSITDGPQCRRLMEVRFGEEVTFTNHKYSGQMNLVEHLNLFLWYLQNICCKSGSIISYTHWK